MARRLRAMNVRGYADAVDERGRWTGKIVLLDDVLSEPLHRRKATTYFVNSMSDLFHENVPFDFICRVFKVMQACPQHVFQVLTKRPSRMVEFLETHPDLSATCVNLPNVWLGVSVEDQQTAIERIPLLLRTKAAVRWVSAEPLLEEIDLSNFLSSFGKIDWLVVGGESGTQARPFNLAWARMLITQCRAASVPVFIKQIGACPYDHIDGKVWAPDKLRSRKGGDPSEWPEDIRVREMPR
jgi:protein gp37